MKRTLRLILVFLLAAILLACPSCAEENGSKREGLTVSFLSVGQGDAILITLPEGNLLIDGGGDASFAVSFAEELERAGVDALDCLIITHPERDHVAYLPALLEEIPVRRAFLPYIEEGFFPLFDETARLAREKGCAEFASDCPAENEASRAFHVKSGFSEANRIICFTKKL